MSVILSLVLEKLFPFDSWIHLEDPGCIENIAGRPEFLLIENLGEMNSRKMLTSADSRISEFPPAAFRSLLILFRPTSIFKANVTKFQIGQSSLITCHYNACKVLGSNQKTFHCTTQREACQCIAMCLIPKRWLFSQWKHDIKSYKIQVNLGCMSVKSAFFYISVKNWGSFCFWQSLDHQGDLECIEATAERPKFLLIGNPGHNPDGQREVSRDKRKIPS